MQDDLEPGAHTRSHLHPPHTLPAHIERPEQLPMAQYLEAPSLHDDPDAEGSGCIVTVFS